MQYAHLNKWEKIYLFEDCCQTLLQSSPLPPSVQDIARLYVKKLHIDELFVPETRKRLEVLYQFSVKGHLSPELHQEIADRFWAGHAVCFGSHERILPAEWNEANLLEVGQAIRELGLVYEEKYMEAFYDRIIYTVYDERDKVGRLKTFLMGLAIVTEKESQKELLLSLMRRFEKWKFSVPVDQQVWPYISVALELTLKDRRSPKIEDLLKAAQKSIRRNFATIEAWGKKYWSPELWSIWEKASDVIRPKTLIEKASEFTGTMSKLISGHKQATVQEQAASYQLEAIEPPKPTRQEQVAPYPTRATESPKPTPSPVPPVSQRSANVKPREPEYHVIKPSNAQEQDYHVIGYSIIQEPKNTERKKQKSTSEQKPPIIPKLNIPAPITENGNSSEQAFPSVSEQEHAEESSYTSDSYSSSAPDTTEYLQQKDIREIRGKLANPVISKYEIEKMYTIKSAYISSLASSPTNSIELMDEINELQRLVNNSSGLKKRIQEELADDEFIRDWIGTLKEKDKKRLNTRIEQECKRILAQNDNISMIRFYSEDSLKNALKLFLRRFTAIEEKGAEWAVFLAKERAKTRGTIIYAREEWSLD